MGTWGPGNFDDDTAADHLSSITANLVNEIAAAIAGAPREIEPDEYGGVMVPCNVELLALIAEKGRWTGTVLPEPATVQRWKEVYLATWEGYIDKLSPEPEHKRKRRAVLVKTFDRLLRASTEAHGDRPRPAKKSAARAKARPRRIVRPGHRGGT